MNFKIVNLDPTESISTSKFKIDFMLESEVSESYNITFKIYDPFFGIMFIPGEHTINVPTNACFWVGFEIEPTANEEKPNLKNGFRLVVELSDTKKVIYDQTHLTNYKQNRPLEKPIVWIIGDSNVWASFGDSSYRPLDIAGYYPMRISCVSLSLNRLIRGDYMSFINYLPIEENDIIVFYFGEIDYRLNIFNRSKRRNESVDHLNSQLLINYKNIIENIKIKYNNKFIIMSPNPPMRDGFLIHLIDGTEEERIKLFDDFNKFWSQNKIKGVEYLNWTKKYTSEDNLAKTELYNHQDHHILEYKYCIEELSNSLTRISEVKAI